MKKSRSIFSIFFASICLIGTSNSNTMTAMDNSKMETTILDISNTILLTTIQFGCDDTTIPFVYTLKDTAGLSNLKNESPQKKLDNTFLLLASIIGFLLVILLLIFGRQKLKLSINSTELEYQENELTQLALQIVKNSELLDQLDTQLVKFAEEDNPVLRSTKLKELRSELKKIRQTDDKERGRFKLLIEKKHRSFFKRLSGKHPSLTEKEKHLCIVLKLGFSSKDIASLYHVTPKSIDMYRYKLRKKLSISQGESFASFFNDI